MHLQGLNQYRSFFTTEEQIHELFAKYDYYEAPYAKLMSFRCGEIKRLVMGLDRFSKTPCGFCFVEYYTHQDALDCMKYIGGTKLDERIIRTDLDPGFQEGRQYGYDQNQIFDDASNVSSGGGNLEVKSATNTEMSMIQDVAGTGKPIPSK